jgi:hypothetical protein
MKGLIKDNRIIMIADEIIKNGKNYRGITGEEVTGVSVSGDTIIIDTILTQNDKKNYEYDENTESIVPKKKTKWSPKDFATMILTSQELMDLNTNAQTDADVFQAKYALETTEFVDLEDWLTKKALDIMQNKNLITEERKNEILEGKTITELNLV